MNEEFLNNQNEKYIGKNFNVADGSVISYHEFPHYIALLVGTRMIEIPFVPLSFMRFFATGLAIYLTWLEKKTGLLRLRDLEVQSAPYIGSSYWISNLKSLTTGFRYKYPDVKEGLKETIAWFRKEGWLN